MKSEQDLINRIEAYLRGELAPEEQEAFEQLRRSNPAIDHQVVAHHNFMKQLADYGVQHNLLADMEDIHSQLDVQAIKNEVLPSSVKVKKLWAKHRFNLGIAASVAILAVLSTLLTTGFFDKNATKSEFNELRRAIAHQTAMIKSVKKDNIIKGPVNPGEFSGTGFALTANGYVVTNNHVIKGADSVYIQNTAGEAYKVKVVYADTEHDLAVLQITDKNFKPFNKLPYTIKRSASDMGEAVYTIGFPKDDTVLGIGYLSSNTGFAGDTTDYQVSIDVNAGNSGGPLLDNRGNIIGVIRGKQDKIDGASFAIKSKYLLQAIDAIPEDSLKSADLILNKKNSLSSLSRLEQIKKMQDYIFMVKAY